MSHRRGRTHLTKLAELDTLLGELLAPDEPRQVVVLRDRDAARIMIAKWARELPPEKSAEVEIDMQECCAISDPERQR